jgi:hexosaminidase
VLGELAAMTPGPYLHVGGDEVEALTPEQYGRFIARTQEIVRRHGKVMIGWEEVGKAPLRPPVLAQLWRATRRCSRCGRARGSSSRRGRARTST